MVGKYVELKDSYKSLIEALAHGGIANDARVDVAWVDAEHIERDGAAAHFRDVHGILVPGGFGDRGIEGKIEAVRYAREQGVPFFGICLGMQCAVIEFARHVCGLAGANSSEFEADAPHLVIDLLPEQRDAGRQGRHHAAGPLSDRPRRGHARLAALRAGDHPGAPPPPLRGQQRVPARSSRSTGCGCRGSWAEKQLVEIIELAEHPYFVAGQFHPEFRSRPWDPHPLFAGFVKAALEHGARRTDDAVTARPSASAASRSAAARRWRSSAGPCAIENEKHALMTAERLAAIAAEHRVPFIYKSSYDKANRSSVKQLPRPGLARACAS